jgi:hypothetical protein
MRESEKVESHDFFKIIFSFALHQILEKPVYVFRKLS